MIMGAVFGTILFMIFLLFILVRADFGLRLRAVFAHGEIQAWAEKAQKRVARLIFRFARPLSGLRIKVEPYSEGRLPRAFLIVANHQSLADIPILIYAFPRRSLRFVTKRELGRGIPMISLYSRLGGHALISRNGFYREGRRELVRLAKLSSEGFCPVVFPEGTRSRTGALRKFQAGAFRIILENAKLPVLSVALDGGFSISRIGTMFSNLHKTKYRAKPIHIYPAPQGKQETLRLLAKVEEDISSQIREWRKPG
jgi:1-acyl-sn-glycerol-3-phosphate acyltransferase